jgi:hypothetical protein
MIRTLSDHFARVFVVSEPHEACMSKYVTSSPLQKLDPRHGRQFDPDHVLHSLSYDPLAPAADARLRQIHERAVRRHQVFDGLVHLAPVGQVSGQAS